jgi:hypothetical protein
MFVKTSLFGNSAAAMAQNVSVDAVGVGHFVSVELLQGGK